MEILTIRQYLRNNLSEWIIFSIKICKAKCVVSGEKFEVIHHKYPFYKILDEVFEQLDIERKDLIEEYDENELELIKDKCLELHFKYGAGVCLTEEIHKEFHNVFGNNTTIEDFDKFLYCKQNGIDLNDLDKVFCRKIKKAKNNINQEDKVRKEYDNTNRIIHGKQGYFMRLITDIKMGKYSDFCEVDMENKIIIIKKQYLCKLLEVSKNHFKRTILDKPSVSKFLNNNNIQILAQKLVIPY